MVYINLDLIDLSLKEKVSYLLNHHQDYKKYKIIEKNWVYGYSGKKFQFDFLLRQENSNTEYIGIIIKDWRRTVGYRTVFFIENILKTTKNLSKVLLVGSFFSDSAQSWARKLNIPLLSSRELDILLNTINMKITAIEP
jgi:hypothetical protein